MDLENAYVYKTVYYLLIPLESRLTSTFDFTCFQLGDMRKSTNDRGGNYEQSASEKILTIS
jgi:hypothetical protein